MSEVAFLPRTHPDGQKRRCTQEKQPNPPTNGQECKSASNGAQMTANGPQIIKRATAVVPTATPALIKFAEPDHPVNGHNEVGWIVVVLSGRPLWRASLTCSRLSFGRFIALYTMSGPLLSASEPQNLFGPIRFGSVRDRYHLIPSLIRGYGISRLHCLPRPPFFSGGRVLSFRDRSLTSTACLVAWLLGARCCSAPQDRGR